MTNRFWLAWPLPVLIATIGLSCSGPDIPLATLPESDAAAPQECTSTPNCPEHFYCQKATCQASTGTCQPMPTTCDGMELPYCGCDGVTYFNDCLRKANGIESSTPMECGFESGRECGGPSGGTCPSGTYCAYFFARPGPCPPFVPGSCWAIPSACPISGMSAWDSCDSTEKCIDRCTAIRQGGTYRLDFMMCH
jgi:hypothetical protein